MNIFNVSCRKVGGIWFLKVGRFNVSFSVSRAYRPIGAKPLASCRQPQAMFDGPFYAELQALAVEWRAATPMVADDDR